MNIEMKRVTPVLNKRKSVKSPVKTKRYHTKKDRNDYNLDKQLKFTKCLPD